MCKTARENLGRAEEQLKKYSETRQEEINEAERQVDRLTDNLSRYLVELLPHLQSELHISILTSITSSPRSLNGWETRPSMWQISRKS